MLLLLGGVAAATTRAVMVTVTVSPGARSPIVTRTVRPLALTSPLVALTPSRARKAGSESSTTTELAVALPRFVTLMVNSTVSPTFTVLRFTDFVIAGSAICAIGVLVGVGVSVGVRVGSFLSESSGTSVGATGVLVGAPGSSVGVRVGAPGTSVGVLLGMLVLVAVVSGPVVLVAFAGTSVAVRVGGSAVVVSVISIAGAAPTGPATLGRSADSSRARPATNRTTREIAIRISLLLRNTSALIACLLLLQSVRRA
jgi:hypothetical protein